MLTIALKGSGFKSRWFHTFAEIFLQNGWYPLTLSLGLWPKMTLRFNLAFEMIYFLFWYFLRVTVKKLSTVASHLSKEWDKPSFSLMEKFVFTTPRYVHYINFFYERGEEPCLYDPSSGKVFNVLERRMLNVDPVKVSNGLETRRGQGRKGISNQINRRIYLQRVKVKGKNQLKAKAKAKAKPQCIYFLSFSCFPYLVKILLSFFCFS